MVAKTAFIFLLFFSTIAVCQSTYDEKLKSLYRNTVPVITSSELTSKMDCGDQFLILDIRSVAEYEVSHLADAYFLDFNSFDTAKVSHLSRESSVVVYCSVGYRSERVGEQLQKLGFTNVYNLYGGIFEWKNNGLPIVNRHDVPTDSVHTYNKSWSRWLVKGIKVY